MARWLVVMALVFSIGTHWMVLQSAAWMGMIVTYAQTSSVAEAFSKTFDGEHPCRLCHFVEEGRKAESTHQKDLKLEAKKTFFCQLPGLALCPPLDFNLITPASFSSQARAEAPPLPPPRPFPV